MNQPANILIVDDNEINRNTLHDLIITLKHTPILAEDGFAALKYIQEKSLDLILLDIIMPEMDGYEVLDHIKKNFSLRHVPIIMISAIDEMETVVQCIKMGADDYLIKPFHFTLLKARINAYLEKKALLDQEERYLQQIEAHNRHLEQRVYEKSQELAEAHERLKVLDQAKTDFLKLISHEFRTPLNGILGLSEILFNNQLNEEKRQEIQALYQLSLDRFSDIVKQALLLTEIQVSGEQFFSLKTSPLLELLTRAIELSKEFADFRQVTLAALPDECHVSILNEEELFTSALSALIKMAIKFSRPKNSVDFSCQTTDNEVFLTIAATGRAIPPEYLPQFFEIFSIGESITPGGDIGLAPPLIKQILTLFKGKISVANQEESPGVKFTLQLKRVSNF